MRKAALVFIVAVLVPSMVLAWLAIRSLNDQELVLERQQTLLLQGDVDRLAEEVRGVMESLQREFQQRVEALVADEDPRQVAPQFNERLAWEPAKIGFSVTLDGSLLAPSLLEGAQAQEFRQQNERFLRNAEMAEVYPQQQVQLPVTAAPTAGWASKRMRSGEDDERAESAAASAPLETADKVTAGRSAAASPENSSVADVEMKSKAPRENYAKRDRLLSRKVAPQKEPAPAQVAASELMPAERQFRELAGEAMSGSVGRFLDDRLHVLLWHRSPRDPQVVFGAELDLARLAERVALPADEETVLAVLDDRARPVARSTAGFEANWKRPFVAAEIGELLPHWEAALYLVEPETFAHSARRLRLVLGAMIAVMLGAIGLGGWLLIADLHRQLRLARQKTDFVSNVSHELKTPLTSIRMFSEMLAEGRVHEPEKQREFSTIISNEAARLSRLISNVLDFARMERGEKRYEMSPGRLETLVVETVRNLEPQLAQRGIAVAVENHAGAVTVQMERDAIAQVLVNLLSNAEKYGGQEVTVTLDCSDGTARVVVADRGEGVPRGQERRIFEEFHRAHDSLASGIQGTGLGLSLARKIARSHGGDVRYAARSGGGSSFILNLPLRREEVP